MLYDWSQITERLLASERDQFWADGADGVVTCGATL